MVRECKAELLIPVLIRALLLHWVCVCVSRRSRRESARFYLARRIVCVACALVVTVTRPCFKRVFVDCYSTSSLVWVEFVCLFLFLTQLQHIM